MATRPQRIAIIGAGPIGLEAALYSIDNGFDVQVFERGRVAENVRDWGHVRLFSPFGLTSSDWGRTAVANASNGSLLPADNTLLTGRQYADRYLLPISKLPQLAERIHERVEVRAIGRRQTWKGDWIGQSERADDPFCLLLQDAIGERTVEADFVLDCSGTYSNHNWIGAGGIRCIGETTSLTESDYRLPDVLGEDRPRFSGKRTLVIGGGYSAATAVVSLARLAEEDSETQVIWLTRSDRRPPIVRIEDDLLDERDRLAERANLLATSEEGPVEWMPGRLIVRIERRGENDGFCVDVRKAVAPAAGGQPHDGTEKLIVDRVIANVGYRPDRGLYEELQVHECYASQGPIKLAAALLGETSADCLAQSGYGAESLCNPEPRFFILGAKSYGRDSRFLVKIGIEQIRDVFSMIADR